MAKKKTRQVCIVTVTGKDMDLNITFQHENIFKMMHRVQRLTMGDGRIAKTIMKERKMSF